MLYIGVYKEVYLPYCIDLVNSNLTSIWIQS